MTASEYEAFRALQIKKAFCPPGEVEGTPILEYVRYIVLPWAGSLSVDVKDTGAVSYTTADDLERDYK